jgi:hypothetical protein
LNFERLQPGTSGTIGTGDVVVAVRQVERFEPP